MITPVHLGFIFGGIPEGFAFILWLIVNILATMKTIQSTEGTAVPVWLAFIWLVPCLGGVLALVAIKRPPKGIDP